MLMRLHRILSGTITFAALTIAAALVPQARAGNIITFDDNANSCGGSVMCSTNGTTGYKIDGTGVAFDLSTISKWFQIDPNNSPSNTSENFLSPGQSMGEPDGPSGGFLVVNNTGATVTSFSLPLTDTFTSQTQSVNFCSGSSGPICDQFQDNKGAAAPSGATETLSGSDLYAPSCSGTVSGDACTGSGGGVTAEFEPHMITYTWNGLDILAGSTFDISFASWQQNNTAPNGAFPTPAPVPEPGSLALLGAGLLGMGIIRRRHRLT